MTDQHNPRIVPNSTIAAERRRSAAGAAGEKDKKGTKKGTHPAPSKLGEGGSDVSDISETFRRNPAGANPVWQSLAGSQKRVLRPLGRPTGRSVDSECRSRAIQPRNYLSRGAFVVMRAGAVLAYRNGLVRCSPAGVREQGIDT
jgi:hypothetical protein